MSMQSTFLLLLCLLRLTALSALPPTEITWYGHSAFKVKTPHGKIVLIDPWITNPLNSTGEADLDALEHADLILITHGHADHVGDAVAIAAKTDARLVANYELAHALAHHLSFPATALSEELFGNLGGTVTPFADEITIRFVPALHSSCLEVSGSPASCCYGGAANGFVIEIRDGPTLYHSGDTDLFFDMQLIPLYKPIDFMFVCIGGQYTMDPSRAAQAVDWVRPRNVVPMHYGTFASLKGTPQQFYNALRKVNSSAQLHVLDVGIPLLWRP